MRGAPRPRFSVPTLFYCRRPVFAAKRVVRYCTFYVRIVKYQKKEEILLKNKENIQELLAYFMILLYQKTKENLQYRRTIEYVEEAKLRLTRNANFDMTIDQMLRKIWEEMNEKHRRN